MPYSMRTSTLRVGAWFRMVRPLGWIGERRVLPVGSTVRRPPATTLAGLSAGAAHFNSWCKAADLKTATDPYVVTPTDVSIVANGLVDVSVEPVVTSVLALP